MLAVLHVGGNIFENYQKLKSNSFRLGLRTVTGSGFLYQKLRKTAKENT